MPKIMDLENLNFKAKDVIQFGVYIVSITILFLSLSAKVDKVTDAVEDMKEDRKEISGESKTASFVLQNDLKALSIRAELNRQNIEIMKNDIEILKRNFEERAN